MNIYLVKTRVTHTEYIAVRAADEKAAEYIAEGVSLGMIDAGNPEYRQLVRPIDYSEFTVHGGETADAYDADNMDEACDYFDELCGEGCFDTVSGEDEKDEEFDGIISD